jgi:hypothetical protein
MKKREDLILNCIGIFFLVFGILAILNSFYSGNPYQVFWLCYIGLILIGFGVLKRNSFIVMSQIYILTIPFLIWNVDFIYWIFVGDSLWGITDYFFIDKALNLGKIISLQHLFTIPVSLYVVKKIRLKRKDAWKLSFFQITIFFILGSLLTPKEANINCVFEQCTNFTLGLPYTIEWFLIFFFMTFITSFVLNFLFFKKKN